MSACCSSPSRRSFRYSPRRVRPRHAGALGDVAAGPVEGAADELAFDLFHRRGQRDRCAAPAADASDSVPGESSCEISGDRCSTVTASPGDAQRHGALDLVPQLAHVAGPQVLREQIEHRRSSARRPACPGARTPRAGSSSRGAGSPRAARAAAARGCGSRSGGSTDPRGTCLRLTRCSRSALVAAITRTSTRCGRVSPTGMISPCSRKRSSFGWTSSGRSPISSRNSVPPAADRTRPG